MASPSSVAPEVAPTLAMAPGVAVDAGPMQTEPWRIVRVTRETRDTFTLALEPEAAGRRLSFRPGQFNMLWSFGVGEVPISMSGSNRETRRVTHTLRAVGAVTRSFQALRKGDSVGLRGPYGTPWPLDLGHGKDVVLIAGGIGLAPLRPAIYHLLDHREKYGRVVVLFGARTPDDLLFGGELESWRGRFDLEFGLTVDRGSEEWRGNVGVVTTLIPRAPFDPGNTLALVCGPEVMMTFAARDLMHRGVAPESIWVSTERNMKCAVGLCGHCQLGAEFVCKDGPVFRYDRALPLLSVREL
jgi:NAD(P)H-flavin reductase